MESEFGAGFLKEVAPFQNNNKSFLQVCSFAGVFGGICEAA
jgi:hypothetical protein